MKKDPKLPRKLGTMHILGAIGCLLALAPLAIHAQTTTWTGASSSDWATAANWSGGIPNAAGNTRINVTNGTANPLIYSAAEGTKVFTSSGLGLVIGTASGGASNFDGAMRITGGSFTSNGSSGHLIGNGRFGSLSVEGGTLALNNTMFLLYGAGTATLSVSNGAATFDTLSFGRLNNVAPSTSSAVINLDGGTLATNMIVSFFTTSTHAASTIHFNGGTLKARLHNGAFIANNTGRQTRLNVRNGGALIDTNGFDIGTGLPLLHSNVDGDNPIDGGLVKNGLGILTLSGPNTYTGNTLVNEGTLELTSTSESLFKIRNGNLTNPIGGSATVLLDGLFRIDVSELSNATGTWKLVDVANLDESFGETFGLALVDGPAFTHNGGGSYSSGEYSFSTVTGNLTRTGTAASEIAIVRGANPIADEGVDNLTGSVATVPATLTYAISNIGEAPLAISGSATIADELNCVVEVTTQPAASINPSASSDLVVTVTPDYAGLWSFTVSVPNSDANEDPYNWTVSGTAIQFEQDLNVTRGAAILSNYSTDQVVGAFGGIPVNLSYTLANAGFTSLAITSSVAVSDLNNVTVTVTTQPSATISTGATSTLAVSFTPITPGEWSFKLTVPNDSPTEGPYVWTVSGAAALYAPEIEISRGTFAIPVASTDPVARNVAGNPTALTYQLVNIGTAPLTLTGSVVVSGASNCAASITSPPATTINPSGGSSTMVVSVTPIAAGAWSFNLSIPTNDSDENPYTWTVVGNAGNVSGTATIFHETFQDGIFNEVDQTTTYNTGEVYLSRTNSGTLENVLKPGEVESPTAAREIKFTQNSSANDNRILARPFAAQSLANNGDRLRLSYNLRLNGSNWALLRTGLFNITSLPEAYAWGHDWNNSFANNSTFGLTARTPFVVNAGYYSFLRDNVASPTSNARRVAETNWSSTGSAPTITGGNDLNAISTLYDIDNTNTTTYQVVFEVERVSFSEFKTLMTLSSTDEFNVTTTHMTVPGTHTGTVITDFNGAFIQTSAGVSSGATEMYLDDVKLERFTGAEPPSLAVTRGANPVADEGSDSVNGSQPAVATKLNYTLTNSGVGALSIGAPVTITGLVNCAATVTTAPASEIAGSGGTGALVVSVTPFSAGAWSFVVSLTNSDTPKNPYNWTVVGNASAGGSPYDNWAAGHGLVGPAADRNATPFNDGVANLLKFGFNMNGSGPDVSVLMTGSETAGLPVWTLVGSGPARVLQVKYIARKGADLSYFPEVSSTLSGTFTAMSGTPSIEYVDANFDRVTTTHPADPAATPKLFGRVRVVDPQ